MESHVLRRSEQGSGGCLPPRSYRNTLAHLAPRRPATCGPAIGVRPLTLEKLSDIYGKEVKRTKTERVRHTYEVATRMFVDFLGWDRRSETLSRRDWDRFIRERRAGRIGPSRESVSNQTIELDLNFLLTVINRAMTFRDEDGRLLLDANPLRGLKTPKERHAARVVLSEEEAYEAPLGAYRRVDWRFRVALGLADETRRHIGAIRNPRWSDIDVEGR